MLSRFRRSWPAALAIPLAAALVGCERRSATTPEDSPAPEAGPVIQSFAPASVTNALAGESVRFSVTPRTADSSLQYSWAVDGIDQAGGDSELVLDTPQGVSAERSVSVTVKSRNDQRASIAWRLHLHTSTFNGPPEITGAIPPGPVTVMGGESVTFSITASDPDAGDRLAYRWFLDGQECASTTASFRFQAMDIYPGDHRVDVIVLDGHDHGPGGNPTRTWPVTVRLTPVTNRAPVIVGVAPTGDLLLPAGSTLNFQVTATDPESDPLAYRWSVDGVGQAAAGSIFAFAPDATWVGSHLVAVKVDDRVVNSDTCDPTYTWSVIVENQVVPPSTEPNPLPLVDPLPTDPPDAPGVLAITWDPVTTDVFGNPQDIVGYRLYLATAPNDFGSPAASVATTEVEVANLGAGTYYVAVTAFDAAGNESNFSDPITVAIP